MILDRWNLLDTAAEVFGMYFEGKCRRYDDLYDVLFRCSTCKVDIPPEIYLSKRDVLKLKRIFKKCRRYFDRFVPYVPEQDSIYL